MEKTRILVIEDDDDARMMYSIMLRSWGYEVFEATTGREGINVAQRKKPDLILLDIMMPDMDGYTVCDQLRADSQFHLTPILFLSALDATDDRIKGYATGGDDFITKGQVDYKEIGARIQAALQRTQRIQRLPQKAQPQQEGTIMGLMSLRGGVGVSTLAVNFARQAAAQSDQPITLIDMAFPVGSVGLWSGITGTRHIIELLSRNPTEITDSTVRNYSVQNAYGFFFIPGPPALVDISNIRMSSVERLLQVLYEAGHFVILDLGRAALPLMWQVQTHCDWLTVVTSGEIISRQLAGVAFSSLTKHGVDPRSLLLIFNDATDKKPSDISIGLPRAPDIFIPYTKNFQQLPEPSPLARLWSIVAPAEPAEAAAS